MVNKIKIFQEQIKLKCVKKIKMQYFKNDNDATLNVNFLGLRKMSVLKNQSVTNDTLRF